MDKKEKEMTYCVEINLELKTITCCHQGCGIVFAVPGHWMKKRIEDHTWWYCPNGHTQHYSGKSETEKLREDLTRQERITQSVSNQRDVERMQRKSTERRLSAQKGVTTKIKNRIAHGVCPCCARTFKQLQRHLKSKHPEYLKENTKEKK